MMKQQIKKFNTGHVSEIINALECDDAVLTTLNTLDSDLAVLQHLRDNKEYSEAVKYLAKGLPNREAIWWAYLCSYALEKNSDDDLTQEALAVTEAWVKEPSESKRRRAGKLGEALEFFTPASWAATAIFWRGGSITPEGRPEVEAGDEMCGEAVANAIIIAAHKLPDESTQHFEQFLIQDLHIAMGGNGQISNE
jgi:hypothetical protein